MFKSITNNLGIKIICLILSFFLWYALKKEESISKTIEVLINPKINESMYLVNISHPSIKVKLQGSRKFMEGLDKDKQSITIDLSYENKARLYQIVLNETYFNFNKNLTILNINPTKIEIELDNTIQKFVEIEAITEGVVAPNYDLHSIKLIPSRLKIKGPEKILKNINLLRTELINIKNMDTTFIQEVQVIPPYKGYEDSHSIKAIISIIKSKQEKVFDKIPIHVLKSSENFYKCTIKPSSVTLKVSASKMDFQGINNEDFIAFINISGFKKGNYELPVYIVKNDIFKLKEISPSSVEVVVEELNF